MTGSITPKLKELVIKQKKQLLAYFLLSAGTLAFTEILFASDHLLFRRLFGALNPSVAALVIIAFGGMALLLLSHTPFTFYKKGALKSALPLLGLAIFFASLTVLIDLNVGPTGFPADINVPFPKSLLFYPAMGFLAEIVFHVIPLSLLLAALSAIFKTVGRELLWTCLLIIPLTEVAFQIAPMGNFPLWAVITFAINLFLFELSELLIFKKYDFISMYTFRLSYYCIWHIVWGYMRLSTLF